MSKVAIGLKLNDEDLEKLDRLCEIYYQSRSGMAAYLLHLYMDVELRVKANKEEES